MAEHLCEYMRDVGIKVAYLHSEVLTLERVEIINRLRRGEIDVLIGVNLLREGLDIPECALVAILDADKEGFLRSETALIQTIGRAARNIEGKVILYADFITNSIQKALAETDRRRSIQIAHNQKHNISPASIIKAITNSLATLNQENKDTDSSHMKEKDRKKQIGKLYKAMRKAADNMDFTEAAKLRDQMLKLEKDELGI